VHRGKKLAWAVLSQCSFCVNLQQAAASRDPALPGRIRLARTPAVNQFWKLSGAVSTLQVAVIAIRTTQELMARAAALRNHDTTTP